MTIRANKFTPDVLLSAPRRSPAIPSADGKLALYTTSTYSFSTHSKTSEICVLDIASGESSTLSKDVRAREPRWLGDGSQVVWLKEGENGNTSFICADAVESGRSYTIGTVSGPVSNLKLYVIEPGTVAVAVSGQADPDGSLHNPKEDQKPHSSGRLYSSLFVRHWDTYVTKRRNAIFTALLQKSQPHVTERQGRYNLVGFTNAIRGTRLECPIPPFGSTDHFDIGPQGLVIVAKDPDLDPAMHTKCNCYFVPRADLMDMSVPEVKKLEVPGFDGAASSPVFSRDGKSIAFLQMREDGYESDQNRVCVFPDFAATNAVGLAPLSMLQAGRVWDRSPNSVMWAVDGQSLFLQAEDTGTNSLFHLDLSPWKQDISASLPFPRRLTHCGYITDVAPAAADSDKLFISSNSLIDNSVYTILDPKAGGDLSSASSTTSFSSFVAVSSSSSPPSISSSCHTTLVSSSSHHGSRFGLSRNQISSIWWRGSVSSVSSDDSNRGCGGGDDDNGDGKGRKMHAWLVRPSTFKPNQKYPVAILIHGGPQGAWNDQWSTRWNPAVFAEQGYVVVCPNPTGSTGYGRRLTDSIRDEWGGRPYHDLELLFEHLSSDAELSGYIDTARAVALGASYGGYMVNWINGHTLGRQFKAMVCHDGVFSMTAQTASDEQYFPIHDLTGPLWTARPHYDRWDPARHTANWSTPTLVIHNELDYRLTIAEGLGAFNVLQGRGVESMFLTFPDENHWVLQPENSRLWHHVVINWINRFVGLAELRNSDGRTMVEDAV